MPVSEMECFMNFTILSFFLGGEMFCIAFIYHFSFQIFHKRHKYAMLEALEKIKGGKKANFVFVGF